MAVAVAVPVHPPALPFLWMCLLVTFRAPMLLAIHQQIWALTPQELLVQMYATIALLRPTEVHHC